MGKRQEGILMSDMMEIAGTGADLKDIAESIVIKAYEQPQFSGEDYKKEAIEKFTNQWFLLCIKSMRK